MSIKSKTLRALTAAAFLGTAVTGVLAAGNASAATPSCGTKCVNIYSRDFGRRFVLDVFRQGQRAGQPVILFQGSNSDPAEDWTFADQGQVSDFFAAGLVSAAVNLHYGHGTATAPDDYAFELEYAPYGVESGLCAGVPRGTTGTRAALEPCGATASTVWIIDTPDTCTVNLLTTLPGNRVPLISGLDTNFSHPVVLTYPSGSYPTDVPRPQLRITNLTGFSQNGPPSPNPSGCGSVTGVSSSQLWSARPGILP